MNKCEKCGKPVENKVVSYSKKFCGTILCRDCQNKPATSNNKKEVKTYDKMEKYDYMKLRKYDPPTEKKGQFTYISWADAWDLVKQIDPTGAQIIVETTCYNSNETPLFKVGTGGGVHVHVTLKGVVHNVWMPVLNNMNKSIPYDNIDSFDVNKAIQRATAKAISLHGPGLYLWRKEDLEDME